MRNSVEMQQSTHFVPNVVSITILRVWRKMKTKGCEFAHVEDKHYIRIIFPDDALINRQRLIKLTDPAEMIAPVEGSSPLFVVDFGEGHCASAKFAHSVSFVGG